MMDYKIIKRTTNVLRGILLAITAVALIVAVLWVYGKLQIDTIDHNIIRTYTNRSKNNFDSCQQLQKVDFVAGLVCFEDFFERVDKVKRGDRLAPFKRQGYQQVADTLCRSGNYAGALEWVKRWVEFDGRDFNALVSQALIKMELPNLKDEGEKELNGLYQWVPEAKIVAAKYTLSLLKIGNYYEAFRVVDNFLNKPGNPVEMGWRVYWDTGNSFNAQQHSGLIPEIQEGNILSFRFQLQPGAKRIRIDPPPYLPLIISSPEIRKKLSESSIKLKVFKLPLYLNQVVQNGEHLRTASGNDPFFYWSIPDSLVSAQMSTWIFTAKVEKGLPADFNALLTSSVAEKVKIALLKNGESETLQRFNLMLAQKTDFSGVAADINILPHSKEGYLELFWRNDQESFEQKNAQRLLVKVVKNTNKLLLDHQFLVNAVASQLRIDFPDIQGIEYFLDTLEVVDITGKTYPFQLKTFSVADSHNIEKKGQLFRVVGNDPYFVFDIPESVDKIITLNIKGVGK